VSAKRFWPYLCCCIAVSIAFGNTVASAAAFDAVSDGDWDNVLLWLPNGTPGPDDRANIGTYVLPLGQRVSATVSLPRDTTVGAVTLGYPDTAGVLDLAGHAFFTDDVDFKASGSILHNGGHLEATSFQMYSGSSFSFSSGDRVDTLHIGTNATASTASASNISTTVTLFGEASSLTLGADLSVSGLVAAYGSSDYPAVINANGHSITSQGNIVLGSGPTLPAYILNFDHITAYGRFDVSGQKLTLDASRYTSPNQVSGRDGADLTLSPTFQTKFVDVHSGSILRTTATGNITGSGIRVAGPNTTAILGADLITASPPAAIAVQGEGNTPAILDAQGYDITTGGNFYIGGTYYGPGRLLNDGRITARSFGLARGSSVTLSGGDDVITSSLFLEGNSNLSVLQSLLSGTGLSLEGGTLNIELGSLLTLTFDDNITSGLDWAFRWVNPSSGGDRVDALKSFAENGLIAWSAPMQISVFDYGDGYTYIGYVASSVPEPPGLILLSLLTGIGYLWLRRSYQEAIRGQRTSCVMSFALHPTSNAKMPNE
jgi:hypothetical protein